MSSPTTPRAVLFLLALAVSSPPASADLIIGRVVDAAGVGIAGVNIDADTLPGGGDPGLSNDGTDANGFFVTTIPAGLYDLTFTPPAPPASTSLILDLENVLVVGTADLGVITLTAGAALSGHVQTSTGLPVPSVDIDVIDLASGDELTLAADSTNAFGNFLLAVPLDPIELRLNVTSGSGFVLASRAFELDLAGATNMGTIVLQDGFRLSATVKRTNGSSVEGADTDTIDVVTKAKLYTPGDNTNDSGFVEVIVPAGTYDFEICPAFADKLVATTIHDVVVSDAVSLGDITLIGGVVLSGTVKKVGNLPVANADLDAAFAVSGVDITLCDDNSAANGTYAVVVPAGTLALEFSAPFSEPCGTLVVPSLVVSGNTTYHAVLPACPFADGYGTGLAGLGGVVPTLGSSGGAPVLGNPAWTMAIANGRGGATAFLLLGFGAAAFPFKQGTLLVDIVSFPSLQLPLPLSGPAGVAGVGAFNLTVAIPDEPLAAGLELFCQAIVQDAGAVAGFAMSNGLHVELCP